MKNRQGANKRGAKPFTKEKTKIKTKPPQLEGGDTGASHLKKINRHAD